VAACRLLGRTSDSEITGRREAVGVAAVIGCWANGGLSETVRLGFLLHSMRNAPS
jgi:hypothetical protein